ncbi:MAG: ribose-5-phosphate isomerase RpiA [Rubrimonas sp.]|uniref:ribose-5-phosphate isomerase RpiA n=1 Tax=Rubrimonas sp. TaxID=2036015 RepID=UPI002FDDA473
MPHALSPADAAKKAAADAALDLVAPGMRLGLGTGSTADWFVRSLGAKMRSGALTGVVGVPTSVRTGQLAEREGVPLTTLDEAGWLDLTVDGADELDDRLTLIKGGGGALLQEKIVACASDRMAVIADATKHVATLGAFPLPVEVVPFGWETTRAIVEATLRELGHEGCAIALRLHRDEPFLTDGGHFIFDLSLGAIADAPRLASRLIAIPGVIETGLFVDIADLALIGAPDGAVRRIERG